MRMKKKNHSHETVKYQNLHLNHVKLLSASYMERLLKKQTNLKIVLCNEFII